MRRVSKHVFGEVFIVACYRKSILVGLLLLVFMFYSPVQSRTTAVQTTTRWPMYQGSAARTGQSSNLGITTPPRIVWQRRLPVDSPRDAVKGLIAGSDGTLHILFCADLFALNPTDGLIRWLHIIPGTTTATPAIGNNGLIYTGNGGSFLALNDQGQEVWQGWLGWSPFRSSPAIAADGNVYFAYDAALFSVTANGQLRWAKGLSTWVNGPVAIGPNGTIYVSDMIGLYAFRPDGSGKWASYLASPYTINVGSDDTIYVGDTAVHAFAPDGTRQWVFAVDISQDNMYQVTVDDISIGPDGTLYFVPSVTAQGSFTPELYALRPDGSLKWKVTFPLTQLIISQSNPPPVVDRDNRIYTCVPPGICYGVSADGQILWEYEPRFNGELNQVYAAPLIMADGRMIIFNAAGVVYAIADPAIVPWLSANPTSLSLQTQSNTGVITRSIEISSTAHPITWTAEIAPNVDWVSLSNAHGVTPNVLDFNVMLEALVKSPYPYSASVVIRTEDDRVANTPLSVPIEVFVGYRTYPPIVSKGPVEVLHSP